MSDYTPTTEQIRRDFIAACIEYYGIDFRENAAQFDRWLAEVKAQAWEEGYDFCFDLTTKPGDTYPYVNPYRVLSLQTHRAYRGREQ